MIFGRVSLSLTAMTGGKAVHMGSDANVKPLLRGGPECLAKRSDLLLGYLKTILIFPVEVFVANILESIHGIMSDVTGQDPWLMLGIACRVSNLKASMKHNEMTKSDEVGLCRG